MSPVSTPFDEQQGVFSPDGKWVAYQSNESGLFEIYVRPFPGPGGEPIRLLLNWKPASR
jgi:hypothetical protein